MLATQVLADEVCALRLEAEHVLEHPLVAGELFETPAQLRDEAWRLLERLRARLGKDAIRRPGRGRRSPP